MLLTIDIGNTNTVVGVYQGEMLNDHFRVASQTRMTSDQAGFFMLGLLERMDIAREDVKAVCIGSVVPALTPVFEEASRRYFDCVPTVVTANVKLPIKIHFEQPDQIGADRIANSVAAFHRWGGPAIVVDFGTATTFDIVDADGSYLGGVIIPGPETSMGELARRAARLFEVRIEKPDSVVGKTTAGALKSGLFYGTLGQVDTIIDRILEETGFTDTTIIATGGLAHGIENASRHISETIPTLTLDGLRIICIANQ